MTPPVADRWWRDAVVYQIYPRSFADSDGDGVGDLQGIVDHLDHIHDLGVDAVWLSPIFRSPMKDFGYDVADYLSVDPVFGTDADLDRLIEGLHQREMRLLLDWVPNHTSDQHGWFLSSRSSRTSPHRDWYVWADARPDGSPPNDWRSVFKGVPAWTWDEATRQYYLHVFLAEQPDLDWRNPAVEEAMHRTLRHWLDRGVDGFRADVVHLIGKSIDLDPATAGRNPFESDVPLTHELLRRIRTLLDSYEHEPMMVGEVYLLGAGQTVSYLGDDDQLHLTFDFRALHTAWDPIALPAVIEAQQTEFAEPAWPTWVLSNHDQKRIHTRLGSEARARAAAVLSLTMRGTPFLYHGDELGLEDAVVPEDRVVDPADRDGCRAPLPWTQSPLHGWGTEPWLPFPPDASERSVEAQQDDPESMLQLYRHLLRVRRASMALRRGDFRIVASPLGTLHYRRSHGDELVEVVVNLTDEPLRIDLHGELLASSMPGRHGFDGSLSGSEAVVVRP